MEVKQGGVRVNKQTILREGEGVVALSVDLDSKYAKIGTQGNGENSEPLVGLVADSETLNLYCKNATKATMLSWPEYAGWVIWSAHVTKYTLYVCLVKAVI